MWHNSCNSGTIRDWKLHRRTFTKEYISVIDGTAPPCVLQTFAHPTSPCSVCSILLQLPDCLTEQAGGEVGWTNVWKAQGDAIRSLTNIYSLARPQIQICALCKGSPDTNAKIKCFILGAADIRKTDMSDALQDIISGFAWHPGHKDQD